MKDSILEELLLLKTEQIKKWSYEDLMSLTSEVNCSEEMYKGRNYKIEVEGLETNGGVKVSVECSRLRFFFIYVGRQKFFYKSKNGDVKDIDGDEFYKRK